MAYSKDTMELLKLLKLYEQQWNEQLYTQLMPQLSNKKYGLSSKKYDEKNPQKHIIWMD